VALKTNFTYSQSSDLKTLYIYDTTGIYDATTNPTGWGGINPTVSNATSDKISIKKVGSNTIYQIEMWPTLPNTIQAPFSIDSSMLGQGTNAVIDDGQYILERLTTVNSAVYKKTARIFLIGQLQCCADQKGKLSNSAILNYALFTLKKAFKTQKFEKANEIYRYAQSLCNDKNCKTC
jgi:hypothetical protein